MNSNFEKMKKYQEETKTCPCQSWARCDYSSGFLSLHHSGCQHYNVDFEIRLMSQRLMTLMSGIRPKNRDVYLSKMFQRWVIEKDVTCHEDDEGNVNEDIKNGWQDGFSYALEKLSKGELNGDKTEREPF